MRIGLIIILLLVCVPTTAQTTVYKSVDSSGRVTFSDKPPLNVTTTVETLHYVERPVGRSAEDSARFEAMREVTAKITEARISRENTRLEQKIQHPVYEDYPQPYYGPRRGGGRNYYPQYPIRPRWDLIGQPATNSQYPAKLVRQYYSDHVQRALQPNRVQQLPNRPVPARPVPFR